MASYLLNNLSTKQDIDNVIRHTEELVLVLRFGRDDDNVCLQLDHVVSINLHPFSRHRFCHKTKMSSFNSPYLTQNYHSKYVERSSSKTHVSNQWRHLMFVKWKYTAREKIDVKVDSFLKIVWKVSNLNKSRRLIYKIRNILSSGFEIYD